MEKVKLTQEQAKAIVAAKKLNHVDFLEGACKTGERYWITKDLKPLNSLDVETFARAWLNGYEIDPGFEVGEIIYNTKTMNLHKVLSFANSYMIVTDHIDSNQARRVLYNSNEFKDIRKANTAEKFFYHMDRVPFEIRVGDIVVNNHGHIQEVVLNGKKDINVMEITEDELYEDLEAKQIKAYYPVEKSVKLADV